VVPVIDGFDELLGVTGHNDAFSSLARFLQSLESMGRLLISARSTFVEFSDLSRASLPQQKGNFAVDYELSMVSVPAWNREDAVQLAQQRRSHEAIGCADPEAVIRSIENQLAPIDFEALVQSPFMVDKLLEVMETDGIEIGDETPVDRVVGAFLVRESGKLVDSNGQPLMTPDEHAFLMRSLADEMLRQELFTMDRETVRLVCEYCCEILNLDSQHAKMILENVSSHAFLSVSAEGGVARVAFRHERFFGYFAGDAIAQEIHKKDVSLLPGLLSRVGFTKSVAEETVRRLVMMLWHPREILDFVSRRRVSVLNRDVSRRVVGFVACACFDEISFNSDDRTVSLVDAVVQSQVMRGVSLRRMNIVGVDFLDVDLRGAVIEYVDLARVHFLKPIFDPTTQVTDVAVNVKEMFSGIVWFDGEDRIELYEPSAVAKTLSRIGFSVPMDSPGQLAAEPSEYELLFDRFLRMTSRTRYFSDDDLETRAFLKQPGWSELWELMSRHGVVKSTRIARRGSKGDVSHLGFTEAEIASARAGGGGGRELVNFVEELRKLS
jgi:hypothetical protein